MNTEPQNPQDGPPAPPTSAVREPRGSGARAAAIVIAAFGGVVLLGTGGTAAFAAVHDVASASSNVADSQKVNADGIESLTVDVAASDVTARFGDVDEATLEVTGDRSGNWRLERDGDELLVHSPDRGFGWWFGGDWFGGDWFGDESVTLTLPKDLNDGSLDADLTLGAGSLDVEGQFNDLGIVVGAGVLSMDGSATTIGADISAGRADLNLLGVEEADLRVSAGKLVAELTGDAPRVVTIGVSAGSLDLTVPDTDYNVTQEVSAGSLDNRLSTSTSARFTIDASVSAGSAILRPGD